MIVDAFFIYIVLVAMLVDAVVDVKSQPRSQPYFYENFNFCNLLQA